MNKELIYSYLQGSCTTEQKNTVRELLNSDPAFRKEFDAISKIWEASGHYAYPVKTDTDRQWEQFKTFKKPVSTRRPLPAWILYPSAAVVVIVLAVTLIFRNPDQSQNLAYMGQDNGVVELSDGSLMWLAKDARVVLDGDFNNEKRELNIEGTAYFEVAPDANKAFLVHYDDVEVSVVGTHFEVRRAGSPSSKVSVLEGEVNVTFKNSTITLTTGRFVDLNHNTDATVQGINSNLYAKRAVPDWAGENLQFTEQRLDVIVRTVARYYDIHIVVDEELKDRLYTVNLAGLEESTALQTLATVTGLVLEKKDDTYSLKP